MDEKGTGVDPMLTAKMERIRKGHIVMKSKMMVITKVEVATSKEKLSLLFNR